MMRRKVQVLALAAALGATGHAPSAEVDIDAAKAEVYKKSCLSVARVVRKTDLGTETGSGFFVGPSGKLVAVFSSVGETRSIEVTYGVGTRRKLPAEVLAADPYTGLALLQVDGAVGVPALEIGGSAGVRVGDHVFAVADTEDVAEACAPGRVAGRDKGLEGQQLATSVLRLHMSPPAESLGAPVFDRGSRLVGVLLLDGASERAGGVGYALPVELVGKLLLDFERHGRAAAVWLGFGMKDGTTTPEVRSLREGSPAAAAGLRTGDVIVAIGSRRVADYQDVIDACYALTPGVEVRFDVLRGLDDLSLTVVPAMRGAPAPVPAPSR